MGTSVSTTVTSIYQSVDEQSLIIEAPILNTDVIFIGYAKGDLKGASIFTAGAWETLSAGSKLRYPKFKGQLYAVANSGTQLYNITQNAQSKAGESFLPAYESDVSAFLVAALPIDVFAASGQTASATTPAALALTITANTYIFSAATSTFVWIQVYTNVPMNWEIYIYTATGGNLTVYRTLGAVTAQASEVFAVTASTLFRQTIAIDVGETINFKYSQTCTFLKFFVRQIGVSNGAVTV